MSTKSYTVTCQWDPEASVWSVSESDVPGLVTEANTLDEIESKLRLIIPELLNLNEPSSASSAVPFELIARKNVDAAWLDEAQRRDKELDDGTAESIPADEVFRSLEASLKG